MHYIIYDVSCEHQLKKSFSRFLNASSIENSVIFTFILKFTYLISAIFLIDSSY